MMLPDPGRKRHAGNGRLATSSGFVTFSGINPLPLVDGQAVCLLYFQRLWLLGFMPMVGTGINAKFLKQLASEAIVGQHAPDRL